MTDQLIHDADLQNLIEFQGITPPVLQSGAEITAALAAIAPGIAANAAAVDQACRIPAAELVALAQSGLLGITVPRRFGGAEADYRTVAAVILGLAAASGSVGQVPQNHFHLLSAVFQDGSEAQQAFFAAEFLAGKRLGNALSERNGKPVGSLPETTLSRDSRGKWRLTGRKFYATGAYSAQWIPVTATAPGGDLALVFVPRNTPGVEVINDWSAIGQRGTHSGTVILTDVVPDDLWVITPWAGFRQKSTFMPYSTLIHTAIDVGMGLSAVEAARLHLQTRSRPWPAAGVERAIDDPLITLRFGELAAGVAAAELLLWQAADTLSAAEKDPALLDLAQARISRAGAFAATAAERFASEALSWAGASSTLASSDLHRHWRDIRTHSTHDPAAWKFHLSGRYQLTGNAFPASVQA